MNEETRSSGEPPISSSSNPNMSWQDWQKAMTERAQIEREQWIEESWRQERKPWEKEPELITEMRKSLKLVLYRERTLEGERGPRCPICGKPCGRDNGEMHEVMVTRGDMQMAPLVQPMIYTAANCVIVHPGECHHLAQHSAEGKLLCMHQLMVFEGYGDVKNFLNSMYERLLGLDTYDLAFLGALIDAMGGRTRLSIDTLLREIGKGNTCDFAHLSGRNIG